MIERLVRKAIDIVLPALGNPRTFYGSNGAYLSRYYITGKAKMPDGSDPFDAAGNLRSGAKWPDRLVAMFLHHFHRGDEDEELHNHPWKWAVCFVLTGGYVEVRVLPGIDVDAELAAANILRWNIPHHVRVVNPRSVNVLTDKTFHRVALLSHDAWTFVVAGPKTQSWGFLDVFARTFTPWKEFIERKGLDPL